MSNQVVKLQVIRVKIFGSNHVKTIVNSYKLRVNS